MLQDEYIYQEILEQESIALQHQQLSRPEWPVHGGRVIITGAGDSYCAALFGQWLIEQHRPIEALPALEASRAAPDLGKKDLLIAISVSGYTPRVLEASQRALAAGAELAAITDNPQSPLAQIATNLWPIYASPVKELQYSNYDDEMAKQYVGYHHDVAQTKSFWAVLLTLVRAASVEMDWQVLWQHTRTLLAPSFYQPLVSQAGEWARSQQTFFLGCGWAKIAARFAVYKMYEFNRLAHFTGIEEYCHTHYFITRPGDTIVFLIDDFDSARRAVEIAPVLRDMFSARIIWLQQGTAGSDSLPAAFMDWLYLLQTPETNQPLQRFLNTILALEWFTYSIGRVGAPNINTFHAGYDTERLVAGTLQTIRSSTVRVCKAR
ncbi:MAG: SIS domain-containing protein [Deltaproteobacteria bacterium]|nr:SIS domain-containing protein [Deltaproteobacteria bacterium]